MNQKTAQSLTVDLLWKPQRIGAPSLSPEGSQVVCAVTQPSMEDNRNRIPPWLFSTAGPAPRPLTTGGEWIKDVDLGSTEEHWIEGAQGDQMQVWPYFSPGLNRKKKHPLLRIIHGGPRTGTGDNCSSATTHTIQLEADHVF